MRFLDRIFGKLTPEQFSNQVLAAIRSAGEQRPLMQDPKEFSIRVNVEKGRVFFLRNSYDMYRNVPKATRQKIMQQIVRTWFAVEKKSPTDFADLGPDLLPVVRLRSYYELTSLRIKLDGGQPPNWPYEILADHLGVGLVYDLPETMRSISDSDLDRWDVSLYDALEKAKQNMMEREHKVAQIGNGLYASAAGDNYDASRMILLDLVRKLAVDGSVVAMVPNRDTFLLTGSDDVQGLTGMVEIAKKAISQRPLSGTAFRLDGDDWQPWLPPEDHPQFSAFKRIHVEMLGQDYAEQKQLLDALYQKDGNDIFVASYTGIDKAGLLTTAGVWTENIPTLLPTTDLVVLMRQQRTEKGEGLIVPWVELLKVVGDAVEPQDVYPPRYRVDGFPTARQLQALERLQVTLK